MGIMDIFNKVAAGGGNNQQQTPPDPNANKMVPNDGTIQNKDGTGPAAIPKAGEGEKSPLENYKDLWQKDEKNDGKEPSLVPSFKADPTKLMEAASKVDFVSGIDPKIIDAAAKGDKDALAAAINKAAQLGFAQSAAATTGIVQKALQEQAKSFREDVMPHILRRNEISRNLREDNELFSNPAVAPMLESVERQFAIKYPKASPAEVTDKAKDYVREFAEAVIKANGGTVGTKEEATAAAKKSGLAREDMDWEKWFNG